MPSYPPVNQAYLESMPVHETVMVPCYDGGGKLICHRPVTRVPNGWLYGNEFVPQKYECEIDCSDMA